MQGGDLGADAAAAAAAATPGDEATGEEWDVDIDLDEDEGGGDGMGVANGRGAAGGEEAGEGGGWGEDDDLDLGDDDLDFGDGEEMERGRRGKGKRGWNILALNCLAHTVTWFGSVREKRVRELVMWEEAGRGVGGVGDWNSPCYLSRTLPAATPCHYCSTSTVAVSAPCGIFSERVACSH